MFRILHLSDLHFGTLLPKQRTKGESASAHHFARGDEPLPEELARILVRDVVDKPRLVVVSGDLGWSGAQADYDYALQFFSRLRKDWEGVPIVVAAGNHDVDLRKESQERRQDQFVKFLQEFHGDQFKLRYPKLDPNAIDREQLIAFEHIEDELFVVAVNSAAHLEKGGTPVFIRRRVLDEVEEQLDSLPVSSRALRIFVLHHHLLPFAPDDAHKPSDPNQVIHEPDATLVRNSAKLQDWLASKSFHVVLHGHNHISHGRRDTLWRRGDSVDGRHIFVIGAGSAGVEIGHRGTEPLTYNVISAARLSSDRWNVDVDVREVDHQGMSPKGVPSHAYKTSVGPVSSAGEPMVFHAERMDDCHLAIKNACAGTGPVYNFISIVEQADYLHPPTLAIGDKVDIGADQVERAFSLLHPEYKPTDSWTDLSKLDTALQRVRPGFRFHHGERLFGHPERKSIRRKDTDPWETRPLLRAVKSLESDRPTKAYVGLYNPEIDALSNDEPLPGLMSIQFIKDKDKEHLDVVATFRKIELSFWWAVNMFEIGKILKWAARARGKKLVPRHITFFAAIAEWRNDPEPPHLSRLDEMGLTDLARLVSKAHQKSNNTDRNDLRSLLEEKMKHTSDTNLDPRGLESTAQLVEGLRGSSNKSVLSPDFSKALQGAADHIRNAMGSKDQRESEVSKAHARLGAAIAMLSDK